MVSDNQSRFTTDTNNTALNSKYAVLMGHPLRVIQSNHYRVHSEMKGYFCLDSPCLFVCLTVYLYGWNSAIDFKLISPIKMKFETLSYLFSDDALV